MVALAGSTRDVVVRLVVHVSGCYWPLWTSRLVVKIRRLDLRLGASTTGTIARCHLHVRWNLFVVTGSLRLLLLNLGGWLVLPRLGMFCRTLVS